MGSLPISTWGARPHPPISLTDRRATGRLGGWFRSRFLVLLQDLDLLIVVTADPFLGDYAMTTPRWLGAAFLFVLVVSVAGGSIQEAATGTGDTASMLMGIAANPTLFRIGLLGELLTAAGIMALAMLLYAVLRDTGRIVALVALGWWLAEGVTLALSRAGAFALIPLAEAFAGAAPDAAAGHVATADALWAVADAGFAIHLFFYLLGALLWFGLFYRSRVLPRAIAVWGLVAESVALVASVADLAGVAVSMAFFAHLALLELVVGLWLLVRGAPAAGMEAAAA